MTTYEVLCCYVSDRWFNYLNPLSGVFTYLPEQIERTLDMSAVDSYLGRLISVAQLINSSWRIVTAATLDSYVDTLRCFSDIKVFWPRPWPTKFLSKVEEYLSYALPAEWIESTVDVFKLELKCKYKEEFNDLNDAIFLTTLQKVAQSNFPPVKSWFELHPHATSATTRYKGGS